MYFKVLGFLLIVVVASTSTPVSFSVIKCQQYAPPKHGTINCHKDSSSTDVTCTMSCDPGYDVKFLAASKYTCHDDGTWEAVPSSVGLPWPDCVIYGRGDPVP